MENVVGYLFVAVIGAFIAIILATGVFFIFATVLTVLAVPAKFLLEMFGKRVDKDEQSE